MSESEEGTTCSTEGCKNRLPPPLISHVPPDSEHERYRYTPLNTLCKEIRLIQIKAGELSDRLECTIFTTPLLISPARDEPGLAPINAAIDANHSKKFFWRALSHVWGPSWDPKSTQNNSLHETLLNGCKTLIRPNLAESLRYLRFHGLTDPIWIDALCIDQENNMEREAQVGIMREIYCAAGETVIYIPIDQNIEHRLDIANWQAQLAKILQEEDRLKEAIISWGLSAVENPALEAISGMLRSDTKFSYWNRMWTLQECCFARSIAVTSGELKVPWDDLKKVDNQAKLAWYDSGLTTEYTDDQQNVAMGKIQSLISIQIVAREVFHTQPTGKSLLDILLEDLGSGSTACTDPRDWIYGFVGMVGPRYQQCASIKADYSRCKWCVWRNATICMIQDSGNLNVLGLCGMHTPEAAQDLQFSWVPRLDALAKVSAMKNDGLRNDDEPTRWEFSADNKKLTARGYVLGTVSAMLSRSPADEYERPSSSRGWNTVSMVLRLIQVAIDDDKQRDACVTDLASLLLEFNGGQELNFIPSEYLVPAVQRTCDLVCSTSLDEVGEQFMPHVSRVLFHLDMLLDAQYVLLMSHESARPRLVVGQFINATGGDLICGVLGCEVPLVVRRCEDGDRIVGHCLVAGFGKGDSMAEKWGQTRDLESFQFV